MQMEVGVWSKFKTRNEFLDAVSSGLADEGISEDIGAALVSGIADADEALRQAPAQRSSSALNLKVGAWVIRDEDLPLLRSLGNTATAVAASLVSGGLALPAVAAAVSSLADICWQVWKKGGRLSSSQVLVYGFLRAHGPASTDRLAEYLREKGEERSVDEVNATLYSLKSLELNDGHLLSMAEELGDDVWRALRV